MKRGWSVLMYQKICWLWELKQKDYIGFDLMIQDLRISILRRLFEEKIKQNLWWFIGGVKIAF